MSNSVAASDQGKKSITIAGWSNCGAFKGAKQALLGLQTIFPGNFSITVKEYETRDEYMEWLPGFAASLGVSNHKTSPIVWFDQENNVKYLGGRDDTLKWARERFNFQENVRHNKDIALKFVDKVDDYHSYDYDLVVIGGGSGGLACSKEAKKLGARVAVLDYVKPSPAGSKWGLGGTCVNVGCIPKKLMHQSALLGEHAHHAKEGFGWKDLELGTHDWPTLVENVQNHIKGLNFGYRVQLREQGVNYLNSLGRFISPHELECTDAKGKKSVITSARFVIATGGRPTALEIPGGELAISSDDIFMRKTPPGKTAVVGAGYVALECAGFLSALKQGEVSVLVRSRPLRTFDQDTVQYVSKYMAKQGVRIIEGVKPEAIEKLDNDRLLLTYGGGIKEEFDTVLAAVGRTPDLSGLNVAGVFGEELKINADSKKIIVQHEQTTVPHLYAIGDVVHGAPELTPVAILAGRHLARRLFGDSDELMDYSDVATAVFTPLELGTVGLSEEEAKARYGEENIDSYISEFKPLEWTLLHSHEESNSFAKIVVLKSQRNRVLGMHIAAPNAGEVIQGFGLALKKGLTYEELQEMVGIHPTVGEEFTQITVSKSSGQSIAKAGC